MTAPPLLRDDGVAARLLQRVVRLPAGIAGAAQWLGAAVLAGGLALDGPATGIGTGVGIAVFLLASAGAAPTAGARRLGWITPALLVAAEYATIVCLAWRAGAAGLPAAYALLVVLAFRAYDLVYRPRYQGRGPARWVGALALGWDGRMIVLAAAAALDLFVEVAVVLAAGLAVAFLGETISSWRTAAAQALPPLAIEDDGE